MVPEGGFHAMKAMRTTVDMIAVFRGGEVPEPIRFRYTERDGKENIVNVGKVIDLKVNHSGQTKDITYTCTSLVGRRLLQYDLKYIGRDVRWELYKIGEM